MKGNFSDDFISSSPALSDVDNDGDGFVSSFDCDDNNKEINPFATDNPATTIDESCGNTLGTLELNLEQLGFYVDNNPNNGNFSVISTYSGTYVANLFDTNGKLVQKKVGTGVIDFDGTNSSGIYLLSIVRDNKQIGIKKIIVR
jgi:hypothetical protein